VNYIGGVETGIKALEWNIDETLVVIVSGNDTVMVLSADFDPVSVEVDLHHDDFGESNYFYLQEVFPISCILIFIEQFVNVGWGKKETQFHGSEGKGAARAKPQVEETPAGVLDDNKPRIRWRGDGAFFAVSYIKRSTGVCINAKLRKTHKLSCSLQVHAR
jgi:elongator complex protein 1